MVRYVIMLLNTRKQLSQTSSALFFACCLFILGQTLAWFQNNSQFVWEWWEDRPLLAVGLFSFPVGLCFWFGIKIAYEAMGGVVWGPRFLIFALSYLTFPLLTWHFLGESMLTPKTLVCVFLSFLIIAVQLFWR